MSSGGDQCTAIVSDTVGSVLVAGVYASAPLYVGRLSVGTVNGSSDMFLAHVLPASGRATWLLRFGGAGVEIPFGIAHDPAGSAVVLCGSYTHAFALGDASLGDPLGASPDGFVAKISTTRLGYGCRRG